MKIIAGSGAGVFCSIPAIYVVYMAHIMKLLFLLLTLYVFVTQPVRGQNRHALVIGLGEYMDKTWGNIHGDRDVPIVKQMLAACGYKDIETLINRSATKKNIKREFNALVCRCKKGDVVYIHFSGHGQQVTDVDGDEDDGFDEAWIPYDAYFAYSKSYKGEKHLVDDELNGMLSLIKKKIGDTGQLLVVVDACHSGDSSRGEEEDSVCVRGTDKDFVIPLKVKPIKKPKAKEDWIMISACRDYQINCELRTQKGEYYGMLTYALCSNFKNFRAKSNSQILNVIQNFMDEYRRALPQDATMTSTRYNNSISLFF